MSEIVGSAELKSAFGVVPSWGDCLAFADAALDYGDGEFAGLIDRFEVACLYRDVCLRGEEIQQWLRCSAAKPPDAVEVFSAVAESPSPVVLTSVAVAPQVAAEVWQETSKQAAAAAGAVAIPAAQPVVPSSVDALDQPLDKNAAASVASRERLIAVTRRGGRVSDDAIKANFCRRLNLLNWEALTEQQCQSEILRVEALLAKKSTVG